MMEPVSSWAIVVALQKIAHTDSKRVWGRGFEPRLRRYFLLLSLLFFKVYFGMIEYAWGGDKSVTDYRVSPII